jgi:ATP-binding cassette, subfamily B, bacterial PglK
MNKTTFIRLWLQIENRRKSQLFILLCLMFVGAIAEFVSIGAIIPFIGALTSPEKFYNIPIFNKTFKLIKINSDKQIIIPLTIFFCLTVVVSAIIRLTLVWVQSRLSYAIGRELSLSMYRKTLYQPYNIHISRNSSIVISGIASKVNTLINATLVPILTIISSSIIMLLILGGLIFYDPIVSISIFLMFGFIYLAIIRISKKRMQIYSQTQSKEQDKVIKLLQEGLGGIRDVLIDGTQETYANVYGQADSILRRVQSNIQIISLSPRYIIESVGLVLIALFSLFLFKSRSGASDVFPILAALALGSQRLLPILQLIYSSIISLKSNHNSLNDTLDLLEQSIPEQTSINSSICFQSKINLKGIQFSYSIETPIILKSLDLTIFKGDRIGIIGSTGSGKSTLLDLIMGLLKPNKGTFIIDEQLINEFNISDWQKHIAHVPQSIFLSDATVSQNIAFGIPESDIDLLKVKEAAKKAQISDVIELWPETYNTIIGERGVKLSGGQRQRLGIARALYKNADLIIFDEATSALDNDTEKEVMQSIYDLDSNLTIIIVAHRISTLKDCNKIVVLESGVVSKIGNYKEMFETNH